MTTLTRPLEQFDPAGRGGRAGKAALGDACGTCPAAGVCTEAPAARPFGVDLSWLGLGRRSDGRRAPWPLLAAAGLVGALALLPIVYLLVRAVTGEAGLAGVWAELFRVSTAKLLGRSLLLALTVAFGATMLAVPLAWLTTRTDLPMRRLWSVLSVLPLVFPSYVGALVVLAAWSPRGPLGGLWVAMGMGSPPELKGFVGAALVLTIFTFPYVYLTVRGSMRRIDPCLEEAARGFGAGPVRTWVRVVLPQLRVPIFAGALLVALYALSDFGAVALMRYDSFTRVIYLRHESSFDQSGAAALSLVLIALAVAILIGERFLGGRKPTRCEKACVAQPLWRLGRWRWPAIAFCGFVALFSVVLPVAVLVGWAIRGVVAQEAFPAMWGPLLRTLAFGLGAALLCVLAALPVAGMLARYPSRFSATLDRLTYVGFALPGVVVALGLAFFALRTAPGLYQTVGLLLMAYVVLFLPQAVGTVRASLLQVPAHLEDASRGLGCGRCRTLFRVTLPLASPGLITGAALVFLTTVKELPATLLLGPVGHDTLATTVWHAAHESFYARAALPSLVLIGAAAVAVAFILRREPDATS